MKIKELNVFINQNGNIALAQEGQIIEITPDMIDLVVGYLKDSKTAFSTQELKKEGAEE